MRGTLEEFSLGDILQLYQISGRTGYVRAWRDDSLIHVIHVDRGRVSGAGADQWNLVDEIRRIEWLGDDVKSQLGFIDRDGGSSGLSLIVRALLSTRDWDYFCERQLELLVYPALIWTKGEFEAVVSPVPRVAPLRVNQSPQQLVLSAARWEEELKGAEVDGYGLDTTWERSSNGNGEFATGMDEHHQLAPLLHRPRTIEDLAAASGLCTLKVIDQIKQLSGAGLVKSIE